MFTGIIEALGTVSKVKQEGSNVHLSIASPISQELKIDQSVSHNGVCLTVTACDEQSHTVTAIEETLKKSAIGALQEGDQVNLERCMKADGRFDGHIVQGHVDQVGHVEAVEEVEGSWYFTFSYDSSREVVVEKGSICIQGTSLTCFNVTEQTFQVAIIPYTYEHTVFKNLRKGDPVNLEFDVIGKYVKKILAKGI